MAKKIKKPVPAKKPPAKKLKLNMMSKPFKLVMTHVVSEHAIESEAKKAMKAHEKMLKPGQALVLIEDAA